MIVLKTPGELELLDQANRIVHRVLDEMEELVVPGVTTKELDQAAEKVIRTSGAAPAFLGYEGFPATLCTSVDDVIVHGIPDETPLEEGSIIGIDCGALSGGYFGDAARTYAVGEISDEARHLLEATKRSLELAVEEMRVGNHLSDIGHAVQTHVEEFGYGVVRKFVGHGIGTSLHEEPQVPNFGYRGKGLKLKPGLVLAIEPMINAGSYDVALDPDGWTARTADGSLSAHFEYSVAVTTNGPYVLGVDGGQEVRTEEEVAT